MDKCTQCHQTHGYKAFEKIGLLVYWFCCESCRQEFMLDLKQRSQREFMQTGGWQ